MKAIFFVPLLFAAVVAQPAADSDSLLYRVGGYPYTTPYAGYAAYNPYTTYSAYTGYPYNYNRYLFKREAETEADSDSLLYRVGGYPYTTPYAGYAAYNPYTTYSAYTGYPYNYNRYLFKREAETEADSDSLLYRVGGYPYTTQYAGYAAYNPYTTYSAYTGYPYNYNRYLFKREAETEADSDSLLYRVGGYPYTTPYAGYAAYNPYTPYASTYASTYARYPFAYNRYLY